jgi:hypothetical protein
VPTENKYPSEVADRFLVRMPEGMRDRITVEAARVGQSMNAWIVKRLEAALDQKPNIKWAPVGARAPLADDDVERIAARVVEKLREE